MRGAPDPTASRLRRVLCFLGFHPKDDTKAWIEHPENNPAMYVQCCACGRIWDR